MSDDTTCEHGESGAHWFAVAGERADDIRACPGPTSTNEIRARHAARIAYYRRRLVAERAGRVAAEAERDEAIVALNVALAHADGTLRDVSENDRRLELAGCQDVLDRLAHPDTPVAYSTDQATFNYACSVCRSPLSFGVSHVCANFERNPTAVEFVECDVKMDPLFGQPSYYCARRVGHRGPHSTDREPGPGSMTWRQPACPCARCDGQRRANRPLPERLCGFMILCPECGNKRCPRAAWHGNDCTGSNEPGQPGSNYP